jgi:hypothetical protein
MSRNLVGSTYGSSVLSFLKAEWKVSDTGSAQCWASSLLTCYIWWVGNIIFLYEIRCFIMFKLHITNGRNSCLKLYNETYLLDKAWWFLQLMSDFHGFGIKLVPFCLLLKNNERYLLDILYATSVFHHRKHDIRVIPLNSMEVC